MIYLWLTVKTRYSLTLLSMTRVVLLVHSCSRWPHTMITLSGWIWLLLFMSCHFPSDQIQGVGCLPSPLSPLFDLTSPPTNSLPYSACQDSNCCHSGSALSHHSGPNEGKAERQRDKSRCMSDMCKSSVTVLWCQLNISACWPFNMYGSGRVIYGPMQNSLTFPGSVSFLL